MQKVLNEKLAIISLRNSLRTNMQECLLNYKKYTSMYNDENLENNEVILNELSKYKAFKYAYVYMKNASTYADVESVIELLNDNIIFIERNIEKLNNQLHGNKTSNELKTIANKIKIQRLEMKNFDLVINIINEKMQQSKDIEENNGVSL